MIVAFSIFYRRFSKFRKSTNARSLKLTSIVTWSSCFEYLNRWFAIKNFDILNAILYWLSCEIKIRHWNAQKNVVVVFLTLQIRKIVKIFSQLRDDFFINIVENKKLASFKIDTLKNEKFYVTFVLKFCVNILKFRLIIVDFAKHEVRNFKNLICLSLSKILFEKMFVFNWENVNRNICFRFDWNFQLH